MYEDITLESLKSDILAALAEKGWSTAEGSFADIIAAPMAAMGMRIIQSTAAMVPMFYVDESSGQYIDKSAEEFFGLERKAGARATANITLLGEAGLKIPAGTVFLTSDGLEFSLDDAVTLNEEGTGNGVITAEEPGELYNIGAGELAKMYVNLAGLTSYVNEAATGGVDMETDAALFSRLDARRKRPPTSGNCYYYEQLALETEGVGLAKTLEVYNGPGTVGVIIADEDGRPVDEAVLAACVEHIEEGRLVCTEVTVLPVDSVEVTVSAEIQTDGSITAEQAQADFVSKLDTYLRTLAETWAKTVDDYALVYNRVAFLLLDVEGVVDFTSLTINGGTENVTLTSAQTPALGEVTVVETA